MITLFGALFAYIVVGILHALLFSKLDEIEEDEAKKMEPFDYALSVLLWLPFMIYLIYKGDKYED